MVLYHSNGIVTLTASSKPVISYEDETYLIPPSPFPADNHPACSLAVFPVFSQLPRLRRPKPSSTWHIDEVFLKISGKQFYLWRAVDDEGEALDILLQSRRNKVAAVKFLRRIIKRHHATPDIVVTDCLTSAPMEQISGIA
jgi:hypothetical protein